MANVLLSTKAVGSTVKLKVNGTAKEFIVVHQGKPSSLYDNSCDGTWLLMKDIYENRQWHNSNVNNLENSTIHSYLELDVAPADRARADMATDAFYAIWDAIRKVSDDLDRLAGDCRVVDAIYAVNDVRRRVGTLKTED